MQKSLKVVILLAIIAVSSLSVNHAYAQTLGTTDADIIEYVAVGAVVLGAVIAVIDGYTSKKTAAVGFSIKKLISALTTSIMGAVVLINFGAIPAETNGASILGVFFTYLLIGWGTDKGLARLDK